MLRTWSALQKKMSKARDISFMDSNQFRTVTNVFIFLFPMEKGFYIDGMVSSLKQKKVNKEERIQEQGDWG